MRCQAGADTSTSSIERKITNDFTTTPFVPLINSGPALSLSKDGFFSRIHISALTQICAILQIYGVAMIKANI